MCAESVELSVCVGVGVRVCVRVTGKVSGIRDEWRKVLVVLQ